MEEEELCYHREIFDVIDAIWVVSAAEAAKAEAKIISRPGEFCNLSEGDGEVKIPARHFAIEVRAPQKKLERILRSHERAEG